MGGHPEARSLRAAAVLNLGRPYYYYHYYYYYYYYH